MPWTETLIPRSQSVSKPSGYIIIDGKVVAETIQCCHCGAHFVSVKGSGHIRGYCLKCGSMTCGAAACDPCRPKEYQLDLAEKAERNIIHG
jgi:hypothetical protein